VIAEAEQFFVGERAVSVVEKGFFVYVFVEPGWFKVKWA
jgi:hypothetical protein